MNQRYQTARKFLVTLESTLKLGWQKSAGRPELGFLEKLALLHPEHFNSLDLPNHTNTKTLQTSIQGNRRFASQQSNVLCQSMLIWGYECPIETDLQQDHLFPYSLGGPTVGTNRIWLCRYHNMVKTSDIHCFPWEELEQRCGPWLDNQIDKMRQKVFKLYN